jgi:hypothetical protein
MYASRKDSLWDSSIENNILNLQELCFHEYIAVQLIES